MARVIHNIFLVTAPGSVSRCWQCMRTPTITKQTQRLYTPRADQIQGFCDPCKVVGDGRRFPVPVELAPAIFMASHPGCAAAKPRVQFSLRGFRGQRPAIRPQNVLDRGYAGMLHFLCFCRSLFAGALAGCGACSRFRTQESRAAWLVAATSSWVSRALAAGCLQREKVTLRLRQRVNSTVI